jgi:general secretion pathway protein F
MALFAYTARDATGQRINGRLEAQSEQSALSELETRGLVPVRLQEAASAPAQGRRVSARSLARFYQQMSDLLRAGVPLLRALRLLAGMKSNEKLTAVVQGIADAVEDGEHLADAMARYSRTFSSVEVSIIRAGERAGFLEGALGRLAFFLERRAEMNAKVIGNMIYPVVLLVVGAGIVVAALIFFVPRFEELYADIELPMSTEFLMSLSALFTQWWPLLLIGIASAIALVFWAKGEVIWQRRAEHVRLRMPVLGALARGLACARFCRVLGTMLENGIPLIDAMQIASGSVGSLLMQEALDEAAEAVAGGDPLAPPLAKSGLIEEDVLEMIAVGESANNLGEVLVSIAETLEGRVDRQLAIAIRLMEPALLLLLAGVVLFIFMALIVPMLRMSSTL